MHIGRVSLHYFSISTACQAVGVWDNETIPDNNMTASSFYDSGVLPYYGRLNVTRGTTGTGGSWCPKTPTDRSDFLQVDMGAVRSVCGVATQGQALSQQGWTKNFTFGVCLKMEVAGQLTKTTVTTR